MLARLNRTMMKAVRLKKNKIIYLFMLAVVGGLFMTVYWLKSSHKTVDLHRVYLEHQKHTRHLPYEGHLEDGDLPQLDDVKSFQEQPDLADNLHNSHMWNSIRESIYMNQVHGNPNAEIELFERKQEAPQRFPIIRPESNLAKDLGIDIDDLDALRRKVEANKNYNIDEYIQVESNEAALNNYQPQNHFHSLTGNEPVRHVPSKKIQSAYNDMDHPQIGVLPGQLPGHYRTSTVRPIKPNPSVRTISPHSTSLPPLVNILQQPAVRAQMLPVPHQIQELATQLSQYVRDPNAQNLLYKLGQMKHFFTGQPHSISYKAEGDQLGQMSRHAGYIQNQDSVDQIIPAVSNLHRSKQAILPDLHSSFNEAKDIPKHLIGQNPDINPQALKSIYANDRNHVEVGQMDGKPYYNQNQHTGQMIPLVDHQPFRHEGFKISHHQEMQVGYPDSIDGLGHQQNSFGISQVDVDLNSAQQHGIQDGSDLVAGPQDEDSHLPLGPAPLHHQVHLSDVGHRNSLGRHLEPYGVLRGSSLNRFLEQSYPDKVPLGRAMPIERLTSQVLDNTAPYTIVHSDRASQASVERHSDLKVLPDDIPPEAYIYEATQLSKEHRFHPSVGNGHVATVIHSPYVFLSGFYNGYQWQSHRAEIPSTVSVKLDGTEPETNCSHKYVLDVGRGIFSEVCSHKFYSLNLRIYAHRTLQSVIVMEVDLAMATSYPMRVKLKLDKWHISGDITFKLLQLDDLKGVSLKAGHISAPERRGMPYDEVYILYDHVPIVLQPPSGSSKVKWVFLTVTGASKNEVIQTYNRASTLIHSGDKLYSEHIQGWSELWKAGYINIKGNLTIAKAVFASMYYLLSSVPLTEDDFWPFVGLSPSGLPLGDFNHPQDYQGRVFCDQELWMFPPVLTFHSELAKILLRSRSRYAAKRSAAQLAEENGVKSGLRYPWQAGISGIELTDQDNPYKQSIFVSGLISHAVLQYLHATNDTSVLRDEQYGEILTSIANYYYKLLQDNRGGSNSFGITGVQAMDKYARSVNNSLLTNAIVSIALSAPDEVYSLIGQTINLNYHHYAEDIYIPFDVAGNFHLEHSNYIKGHPISQADVVLVGYPLMRDMTSEIRKNDLEIYEKVLDTQAPPTSWAMYAVGWLEVSETRRAIQAFDRQFPYLLNDFQIWTEKGTSLGAANYISAAGAFLQSITNGFLGLRYHKDHLTINPILPPGAEYMQFVGIDYLGSSLDIWVWPTHMAIHVAQSSTSGDQRLKVFTSSPLFAKILVPGHSVNIARAEARIMPSNAELPI